MIDEITCISKILEALDPLMDDADMMQYDYFINHYIAI